MLEERFVCNLILAFLGIKCVFFNSFIHLINNSLCNFGCSRYIFTGRIRGGGDHAACLFISLAECPSNGYNYLFLHYRDTIGRQ